MNNLIVTEKDFERLCVSAMNLLQDPSGPIWGRQMGRFENVEGHYTVPPRKTWTWGYWIEDGWASVVLARTFLLDNGHDFEVFYDQYHPEQEGGWVIFTDYRRED